MRSPDLLSLNVQLNYPSCNAIFFTLFTEFVEGLGDLYHRKRVAKGFCVTRDGPKISSVMRDGAKISHVMRDWTSQRDA